MEIYGVKIDIREIVRCHRTAISEIPLEGVYFFIELTSYCNMSCEFCPSRSLNRRRFTLKLDTVMSFLEQLYEMGYRNNTVEFHALGEPLLYPHLLEVLKKTRELGFRHELITNGLKILGITRHARRYLPHGNFVIETWKKRRCF